MKNLVDIYNYRQSYLDLDNIGKLEYDWNGYGAPAGTAYPIYRAVPLLNLLKDNHVSAPDVYATANRTVQFEWRSAHKYLEFEIFDDCISTLCVVYKERRSVHNDCNYSYEETDNIVEQVKRWEQLR